jgi:IS605 OrfB family transposase
MLAHPMTETAIFTYKARVHVTPEQDALLSAWAELHGRAERRFASAYLRGDRLSPSHPLFKSIRDEMQLSDRNASAALIAADGKVRAAREARKRHIAELQGKIVRAEKVLTKARKRPMKSDVIHRKQRRLVTLRARLAAIQSAPRPKLVFGSRKLFRAQFNLSANGFANHADWLTAWRASRSGEILIIGRNSEEMGNKTCRASFDGDAFTFTLRVPYALEAQFGKRVVIGGVRFHYGADAIISAISAPEKPTTKSQKATAPATWRFVRPDDGKGWLVYASTHVKAAPVVTRRELGAIGADFNADHIAVSEIDRHGNPLPARCERVDLVTRGKTANQRLELVRVAAKEIAEHARAACKPVVIEKLDFSEKKRALEAVGAPLARMLSALAYSAFAQALRAACFRAGVEVIDVNPAWTSVIGAVNYATKTGLSVHLAAAVAIARRGLSCRETAVGRSAKTPDGRGGHVTFALPERNRAKHVWSHWAAISRARQAAIKSHFLTSRKRRTADKSLDEDRKFLQEFMAVTPCANRAQSGSERVHAK